jgi:hypothetical protein
MSSAAVIGLLGLALLKGALVWLPDATAFARLGRLRSPAWVAVLPGMIILGTFGVARLPATAFGLVVLAALATPLLAIVSVLAVVRVPPAVRGRRAVLLGAAVGFAALAFCVGGWIAELSQTVVTGLGCLAIGVGIVRLIPRRWLPAGVLAMCAVDVALLALGPGTFASVAMADAADRFHGPSFDHAAIGPAVTDYPDLVLAAVLGGVLAGDRATQRRAAVLLPMLAGVYALLLTFVDLVPATVPIAMTYFVFARRRG